MPERELKLKHALEHFVRVVRFEPGRIEIALTDDAPPGLAGELSTQARRMDRPALDVAVSQDAGAPTIAEVRTAARAQLVRRRPRRSGGRRRALPFPGRRDRRRAGARGERPAAVDAADAGLIAETTPEDD